jgi:CHASE3 domain sensor protein
MLQPIINTVVRIFNPVTRVWLRIPVRMQGKILIILPLIAITIAAVSALLGNHQRANIQDDIQRHFKMVRSLNEVVIFMINAETSMRGYLLTRRKEFLEPYTAATQRLPSAMTDLRALAEGEPRHDHRRNKLRLLGETQLLIDRQMEGLIWLQNHVAASQNQDPGVYNRLISGKGTMDEIRTLLTDLQIDEERLMTERIEEINAIRRRDYLAITLALFIGMLTRLIARYLVSRENTVGPFKKK